MLSMLLARLISSSLLSETIAHQDVPLISDAHCMRLEGVIRFRPSDMGKLSALLFLSTVANESPECSPDTSLRFGSGFLKTETYNSILKAGRNGGRGTQR